MLRHSLPVPNIKYDVASNLPSYMTGGAHSIKPYEEPSCGACTNFQRSSCSSAVLSIPYKSTTRILHSDAQHRQYRIMEQLPSCALNCLARAAIAADCGLTDISCACGSKVYFNSATSCVTVACSVREALYTQNQTSALCHVEPYTDRRFVPVIIAFFILTLIVVLLRIASRVVSQAKFWYDDYFNFAAFVATSVYTLNDISLSNDGFGVDLWAVPQGNIDYILINFLVGSVLYLTSRALVRISIILFYLRIFGTTSAKAIIMWTLAVVVSLFFGALFPIIFQCSPVSYTWLRWDGTHQGQCINFRIFIWAITSIAIAVDFWIVIVAYRLVAPLHLPLKKKIMVSAMFATGLLTIAISIARLPYIDQFTVTKNPTIDWVPITLWSALENFVGVICACLPSLPALLKSRLRSKTLNTSGDRSILGSQSAKVGGHEIGSLKYAPIYEMETVHGQTSHIYQGGGNGPVGSPHRTHNFGDPGSKTP
ncbi:hypothetical protein F5B22DRAFT_606030 [Xylaria bambusicola]|uniref:uncharacterized protein n=1 Tax=Xylaria bambusicola TaxID=326684 RepID=UPI002008DFCD|nr:uncharacterized protein F5B22DRAFT_606030 [Xylaria bambusicola]KAI0517051.1 hypothetical protein F5B22DRAFT_606030 [Xylaria bambusicola]